MPASNAVKATSAGRGLQGKIDRLAGAINLTHTQRPQAIQAELHGADRCEALGISVIDRTPILALCRSLIAAGADPNAGMTVCRGGNVAVRVHSLGAGAGLTVSEEDNRPPRFKHWKPRDVGEGAPRIARDGFSDGEGTS
jgi:hypothetical protein